MLALDARLFHKHKDPKKGPWIRLLGSYMPRTVFGGGTAIGYFRPYARIGRVMLKPAAAMGPTKGGLRISSKKVEDGYEFQALVPLKKLTVGPRVKEFLMEIVVSSDPDGDGQLEIGTVFRGDPNARYNCSFAHMLMPGWKPKPSKKPRKH